ncbi:MAG: phenylalanine--tRNA ligase subunit beta, partial [Betaproteobacteria bacterium]|nr:phenylalanine--tRNA ligase subunit beta [Betaproteobacteria bacterium]
WQQKYALPAAPVIFELDVAALVAITPPQHKAVSRMPTIRRDIALLVPDKLTNQEIIDSIKAKKIATIIDFSLFDLYRGASVESGRKSLAFRIVMQDTDRTLTDSDADHVVAEIIDTLHHKFDVTIRK